VHVVAQIEPQVHFVRFAVASCGGFFFADDCGEFSPDDVGVGVSFSPQVDEAAGFTMRQECHLGTMR